VREASAADLEAVLAVERAAFGRDDEAELVRRLLSDPSARPLLSLVALVGRRPVGHILFTRASLVEPPRPVAAALLAPLAVMPDSQRRGVGASLIGEGLRRLGARGVELVFVLGYPEYYGRHGFRPAGRLGLDAPFPIAPEHADAWMVRAPGGGRIGTLSGRVECADALNDPACWRE
jgi:putative acetyltransferase